MDSLLQYVAAYYGSFRYIAIYCIRTLFCIVINFITNFDIILRHHISFLIFKHCHDFRALIFIVWITPEFLLQFSFFARFPWNFSLLLLLHSYAITYHLMLCLIWYYCIWLLFPLWVPWFLVSWLLLIITVFLVAFSLFYSHIIKLL